MTRITDNAPVGAAVGIDLGTTNTVVAVVREGRAVTLADPATGRRLLPSVVSFHPSGDVLVGEAARERRLIDPVNTVYSVKRLIGRSWSSPEVQQARNRFPFDLREGAKSSTVVVARGERYGLPEISAFVLRRAKALAEAALGEVVDKAVVTVPANFNDLQRAATKVAGKLAGLEVLRILNEPTAAALAYGQVSTAPERLAVYDLGGGTFDITLLDLSGNVFEVLATSGDMALGGDDIDLAIADIMADQIVRAYRFDPRVDTTELGRLRLHAERLKQLLSTEREATVTIDDLGEGLGDSSQAPSIEFSLTRDEVERETAPMLERTLEVCRFAMASASLTREQIDRVILVGGPTRMPIVAREVQAFFGKAPTLKVNPDEVVALGAAIQAHVLDRARARRPGTRSGPMAAPVISQAPESPRAAPPSSGQKPRPLPPSLPPLVPQPIVNIGTRSDTGPEISLPRAAASLTFEPEVESARQPPPPPSDPPSPAHPPAAYAGSRSLEPPPASTPIVRPMVKPFAQFVPNRAPAASPATHPAYPAPPEDDFLSLLERSSAPSPPQGAAGPRHAASGPSLPAPAAPPRPATPLKAPLLIDVTPLSLRVETVGGYTDLLIAANTAVPCDRTRVFLTATDNQTAVIVRVAQGEESRFESNTFLGELQLTGIVAAPRGDAKIGVTFEIDVDGILNVRAKDIGTGNETQARLQLLGAQTEPADVLAMERRQASHAVIG